MLKIVVDVGDVMKEEGEIVLRFMVMVGVIIVVTGAKVRRDV